MYVEDQYIHDQFVENFVNNKIENIVIYGTGVHTELLLKNTNDNHVIGLMDAKRTGEVLWGYPVLSMEEVAAINNVSIVIIARNAVINVIYRRIEDFIKSNHISVYDINGKDLSQFDFDTQEHACFQTKEEELRAKIKEADVVTFDIFDTLLTRCVLRPKDIYSIMDVQLSAFDKEYCFSQERIRAEEDANVDTKNNPTIQDIYRHFQKNTNVSEEESNRLMQMEIDVEKRYLTRREKMCEIFAETVKAGKEVYLISDMYLTEQILREILHLFHIAGYRELYVSCDRKCTKTSGLFETFMENEKIAGKKCLHIGDNLYSDIVRPKQLGFDTYQVYSVTEMFESSIYSKALLNNCCLEENIALAYYAVHAYNNPFGSYQSNGKLILSSVNQTIKLFIAPVIFKYMIWLVKKVQAEKQELVIFPSRDGFLLQQIYDEMRKADLDMSLPPSVYLYTSRRAAMVAAASNQDDVKRILDIPFHGLLSDCIYNRFNMKMGELGYDNNQNERLSIQDLKEAGDKVLTKLLGRCKQERSEYLKYIQKEIPQKYKNVAFVDFVAMGTVQDALQRLTNETYTGHYFLRRSPDDTSVRYIQCDSLYKTSGDFESEDNIYKFYYFLETIITSYEPTFKCMDENGNKVFFEDTRKSVNIEYLKRIHEAILEYCREIYQLLPDLIGSECSVSVYDTLLGFFSTDYSEITDQEFCHMVNVDEFMGNIVTENNR